jgi:hypothetical protein
VASIECLETSVTNNQPTAQDIPWQRRRHRPNFETGAELARSVKHEIIEFVVSHWGHESYRYVGLCVMWQRGNGQEVSHLCGSKVTVFL